MKRIMIVLAAVAIAGCASGPAGAPQSWGKIHNGMTREEVHALVGVPVEVFPEEDHADGRRALSSESWGLLLSSNKYVGLSVSYDSDGRVVSVNHAVSYPTD
jgi:hypothetical protein